MARRSINHTSQNILEFLSYYCGLKSPPYYAVNHCNRLASKSAARRKKPTVGNPDGCSIAWEIQFFAANLLLAPACTRRYPGVTPGAIRHPGGLHK